MKKIFSLIIILALVAVIFTLAACSGNKENPVTSELTTLKEQASSIMEGVSSGLSELDEDLTAEGNVSDSQSSTGLLEDMTSDKAETTTESSTSEASAAE